MGQLNQDFNLNVMNEVVQFNEKFKEAALIEQEKYVSQLTKMDLLSQQGDEGADAFEEWYAEQKE